jgi:hypothetical protein
VHPIGLVLLGGQVSLPFGRDAVHDNRAPQDGGRSQRAFQAADIVSVHWPDVRETHVLEQVPGRHSVAPLPQVMWQISSCGLVRTPVVVEHDDDRPTRRGGDVVQRLPAHTSGQGAVTDDRDHATAAAPGQLEGVRDPVGVPERRGRVGVLHEIVRTLAPRDHRHRGGANPPQTSLERPELCAWTW